MTAPQQNRFEKYSARAWLLIALVVCALALLICEVGLRLMGFGHPVVYEEAPEFAYRPRPNQEVSRFGGAIVRINNLGLRAMHDWDASPENKVLFLGNSVTYGGSYVNTSDLFSERAVPQGGGWIAGDGGVNGWGVENIHGLVVRRGFQPARTVVTVLIEGDFYRGLSQRQPFFQTSPPLLALQEAIPSAWYQIAERLHPSPDIAKQPDSPARAATAVERLRQIDSVLRANGIRHLMYLSPYQPTVAGAIAPDTVVARLLDASGLRVIRLNDRPELRAFPRESIAALYHDRVHLSTRGHAFWADMIRADLSALLLR